MSDSPPPPPPPTRPSLQQQQQQQSSVSRSSSFSRAASFRFTPRQSPSLSESAIVDSTTTSPVLNATSPGASGGLIINHNVPPPPGQAGLTRHGSRSSRPGSTIHSPISSPREEHKGTW
jgi:hypothetical protein